MSATEAGPSRRRRQYASRACNACRRRRCKCDGVQPTCGTCATSGHECSWSTESDARRPATKQLVESLRVKIQVLEAEVARLKDQVSTPAETSSASPALFVEGSSGAQQPPASVRSTQDEPLISGDSGASASQYSSPAERPHPLPAARSPSTPTNQFTATVTYKYIFQIDPSIPSSEQPTDTRLSLVCDWNRYLPTLEGTELTRLEHDTILSRCFKYGTSYLLALVPEIFLHDMLYALTSAPAHQSHTRLQHYSPMLHCAILSYASAFSDNETIRSRATRDKFAQQAKRWLDEELKSPVMGLLRALALLADYHCGIGDRNTGYMYMGMSIRGARTMLAKGERNHWVAQGVVTYPESVTREWHYWSIFAQDKLMALDFERMSDMPVQQAGINLPAVDAELDSRAWPMNALDTTATSKSFPKITTLAFLESCKLMVIAARIIDATHTQGQAQEDGVVINLHLQLDTWFNNLPEVLIVWARTASPLPHVIMLHICYWSLLIHLHQPFYQRGTPSHAPAVDLSVKMCERATQKIVQFLNIFKIQHDLRFFPRNMLQAITVCGNALLMESAASPSSAAKKRTTALEGVDACIRALRAISVTWPCAAQQATALEARRNQQTPLSTTSMEVDELEDDPMEDLGDVKRVYHLAGQQPSRSQSHGLAVPQMVTSRPSERVPVRIKIRMFRPDTCGAEKGWDLALMKAFPVTWIA